MSPTCLRAKALPLQSLQTAPAQASRDGLVATATGGGQGSNHVSLDYSNALLVAGVRASVGSVRDSYDNVLPKTVNSPYQAELIHRCRTWPTGTAVEIATFDWVTWWNTKSLHQALDYRAPSAVEAA